MAMRQRAALQRGPYRSGVMHPTGVAFRAAIEAGDHARASSLLADDVTFHSPIVHRTYTGRDAVAPVLAAVSQVFEDFRYTGEYTSADGAVLVFAALVGGRDLEGIDMFRFGDGGQIVDFTVMVRPYQRPPLFANAWPRCSRRPGRMLQPAVIPASLDRMAPCTFSPSSLAANAKRPAIWAGVAGRRWGVPVAHDQVPLGVLGELNALHDVGVGGARGDRVDPDLAFHELHRERLRQLYHGALGHAVRDRVRAAHEARVRGDVHDVAAGLEQVRMAAWERKK